MKDEKKQLSVWCLHGEAERGLQPHGDAILDPGSLVHGPQCWSLVRRFDVVLSVWDNKLLRVARVCPLCVICRYVYSTV